jgi:CubicO group peptidase (beta-lactamase class C family)
VLDVDYYLPQAILPACNARTLPRGDASEALASALPAVKAYSDQEKGYGLIVLKDGVVVHESYGEGLDETLLTASASMAKSVMSLMMGIAIDKGMIGSVDEPLGMYLPEWADDPRGAITIQQALQMASGLAASDLMKVILAEDSFAVAAQTPMEAAPGSTFRYNNAVSQLLGEVLDRQARAAGYAGYPDFLLRELWCPMGGGKALLWVDPAGKARTYAGLHAGIRDYAKIGELIRNKGRVGVQQIVPEAWIAEMTTPSPANGQYGYQVWLGREWTPVRTYSADSPIGVPHSEPFVAKDLVYFDGFGGQRVYVLPSQGITVARVGETNLAFDESIIPNALARALED